MLANVFIESFVLMDIKLGGSGKESPNHQVKSQITKLKTSPI
jgi:hypothetical protein